MQPSMEVAIESGNNPHVNGEFTKKPSVKLQFSMILLKSSRMNKNLLNIPFKNTLLKSQLLQAMELKTQIHCPKPKVANILVLQSLKL
jgi:hypothetical protein